MAIAFNRKSGAVSFPTTTTGEVTLQSLDPAAEILLDLFQIAIETELGPRWNAARTGTALADKAIVADTIDVEPTQEMLQERHCSFPLLAVYREGEPEVSQFTLTTDRITQRWGVDYVLGPLDAAGYRKLGPALTVVAKIITEVVRVGGHPEYGMDGNSAQPKQVLIGSGNGTCEFSSVRVIGWQKGQASFATEGQGPTYWWMSLQLETTEDTGRDDLTLGFTDHTADWAYNLSDGDTSIEDFVEAEELFEG